MDAKFNYLLILLMLVNVSVRAEVLPVVVTSSFENDSWYPLPIEQMKNAVVDTALTRISETGKFAYLYKSDATLPGPVGSLQLAVALIEPAETAKVTIRLDLPASKASYVSTSSASLSRKDYQGIFTALEQLGIDSAIQLTESMQSANTTEAVDENEQAIRKQIIKLNANIISMNKTIGILQQKRHNDEILRKLDTLDDLAAKISEHHAYVRQSDIDKHRKLDAIYDEIKNLNIGSNTDNRPPEGDELTNYDISLLPVLKSAAQLKYDKQFSEARATLLGVITDPGISAVFRDAVNEEYHINLPLYEADTVINETASLFMRYLKNDEYKAKLQYAGNIYDSVLLQPELSFKKRVEIRQKRDQLNLVSDSMGSAAVAIRGSSLDMLTRSLRHAYARHNAERAMGYESASGPCPSRERVDIAMKKSSVDDPVIAYNATENRCELILEESDVHFLVFVFSDEITSYDRRKR